MPQLDALFSLAILTLVTVAAIRYSAPWTRVVAAVGGLLVVVTISASGSSVPTVAILAVALAGAVPGWVSGYRAAPSAARRAARRVASVCAAVVVVAALAGAAALVEARIAAERGIAAGRAGVAATADGETGQAMDRLHAARRAFADAQASTQRWWAGPSRLVPGLASQVRAVDLAARHGERLAADLSEVVALAGGAGAEPSLGELDLETLTRLGASVVDLDREITQALSELRRTSDDWLLPPLQRRLDELLEELDRAEPVVAAVREVTDVLPSVLGADGPRRYLALFATPAEARELGGLVGNWVELEAVRGQLRVSRAGSNDDLHAATGPVFADPDAYPERFLAEAPQRRVQNWSSLADFPTAAAAVAELYPAMGGRPIDGLVYLEPAAVAALLRLTGPVPVAGRAEPLTAERVEDFLLRGQYEEIPDKDARKQLLTDIATTATDELLAADLSSLTALHDAFEPVVRERRLLFTTFDPIEARAWRALGIDGSFEPEPGVDFVSVVQVNRGGDKLDPYLARTFSFDVVVDPVASTVEMTTTVKLANEAPRDLPAYVLGNPHPDLEAGTNLVELSLYGRHPDVVVVIDGKTVPTEQATEYGLIRTVTVFPVPRASEVTVVFTVQGDLISTAGQHRLTIRPQSVVRPAQARLFIEAGSPSADETSESGPEQAVWAGTLVTDLDIATTLRVDRGDGRS